MKPDIWHKAVASVGGIGYIPKGSGTFGAAAACVIYLSLWVLGSSPVGIFNDAAWSILTLFTFFIGRWSSGIAEEIWGEDSSKIVVDELLGMMLTLCFVPVSWLNLSIGFVLFRFYDIVKPFGIRKLERFPNGWGVMLDDAAAGLAANLTLHSIIWIEVLPQIANISAE